MSSKDFLKKLLQNVTDYEFASVIYYHDSYSEF